MNNCGQKDWWYIQRMPYLKLPYIFIGLCIFIVSQLSCFHKYYRKVSVPLVTACHFCHTASTHQCHLMYWTHYELPVYNIVIEQGVENSEMMFLQLSYFNKYDIAVPCLISDRLSLLSYCFNVTWCINTHNKWYAGNADGTRGGEFRNDVLPVILLLEALQHITVFH